MSTNAVLAEWQFLIRTTLCYAPSINFYILSGLLGYYDTNPIQINIYSRLPLFLNT